MKRSQDVDFDALMDSLRSERDDDGADAWLDEDDDDLDDEWDDDEDDD